ncbi:MAG: single-stranded DNA-binding protein [Planctomycetes bacterium]|nr:single-stranded DNA-binding protein [Planctomycetota bacterium]
MANLNRVMLIGRLTRDPETRHTPSGQTVTTFGLAINRTYRRKDSDEQVEETTFVDCEAWGKGGETFARYMKKGRQAYVEGRLKLDSWEKDGQKRSKLSVVMEEFQVLDGGAGGGGGGGGGGGAGGEEAPRRRAPARPQGAPGNAGAGAGDTPQDDYAKFDDDIPF